MSGFRDAVQDDLHGVFLNLDEFAERHTVIYDGETYEDIPVVITGLHEKDRRQLQSDHAQGLYLVSRVMHCALDDLGGNQPEKGCRIRINEREGGSFFHDYYVASSMQVGSLVSQMTANVVMTPADHYIKRELCAPYYARYMDDMGAIIEGKDAAWELVEEVDNYLQTNLGLNLNQKTAVIPIGNPVEFVGRKISPVKIELRRQTTLGMKKHLRYVQDAYAAGEIDLDYALSVITSYRGLFKDVTSDAFLEKMLDEFVLSRPALEA